MNSKKKEENELKDRDQDLVKKIYNHQLSINLFLHKKYSR